MHSLEKYRVTIRFLLVSSPLMQVILIEMLNQNAYQYLNPDGVATGHDAVSLCAVMGIIRRVGPGCSIGPTGRRDFWRHLYQPTPAKWT